MASPSALEHPRRGLVLRMLDYLIAALDRSIDREKARQELAK